MPPIPKADRLLRRITTLHDQLRQDDDAPSRLEQDLMLGYLRELYLLYAEPTEIPAADPKPEPRAKPESPRTAFSPARPEPAPTPPPAPEPAYEAPPPVPSVPVPPPPAPTLTTHTARVEPMVSDRPAPNPPQPAPAPNMSPDVAALFEEPEQNGMAGRIIRQRITDLNRALSINNRVLFANKLFDGNESLTQALKTLNLRGSMANAKPLLVDLAQQHDWAREDRQETAREFINLVRRRYA
ncbi:hypothetical protein LEM8419_01962 [Neolewinella maritima]|uniref:Uncharacterized protein n=1 Tax=Neolewinella maritima TaxID=1383882 RepID=A0ABM9B1U7_9BACT|nr:hypothetical protein [Neolewinella maritima]CAH1000942.1 hypothetical protein LEM8419_01962 [Neolewinella maritima]